jgi:ankyrin repeat protein
MAWAIDYGVTDIVEFLVAKGADVNDAASVKKREKEKQNFSLYVVYVEWLPALMRACWVGNEAIVKFLISKGANVNKIAEKVL